MAPGMRIFTLCLQTRTMFWNEFQKVSACALNQLELHIFALIYSSSKLWQGRCHNLAVLNCPCGCRVLLAGLEARSMPAKHAQIHLYKLNSYQAGSRPGLPRRRASFSFFLTGYRNSSKTCCKALSSLSSTTVCEVIHEKPGGPWRGVISTGEEESGYERALPVRAGLFFTSSFLRFPAPAGAPHESWVAQRAQTSG